MGLSCNIRQRKAPRQIGNHSCDATRDKEPRSQELQDARFIGNGASPDNFWLLGFFGSQVEIHVEILG